MPTPENPIMPGQENPIWDAIQSCISRGESVTGFDIDASAAYPSPAIVILVNGKKSQRLELHAERALFLSWTRFAMNKLKFQNRKAE